MLLAQAWAIGELFSSKPPGAAEIDLFISTGAIAGDGERAKEPRNAEVDEKVAEILRTGKVIVR